MFQRRSSILVLLACLALWSCYPVAADEVVGGGSGLRGEYYNNLDLTDLACIRQDAVIQFSWGDGSPVAGMEPETFSVRWVGRVQANYSETYTFATVTDDGIRLWVNGQPLIDNWTDHGGVRDTGTIALTAGKLYDIRIEYYENGGGANIALFWSSPSQPEQIIPQSFLYPPFLGGGKLVYDTAATLPQSALALIRDETGGKPVGDPCACDASLSSDGTKILFTSGRHATWTDPKTVKNTEIYVMPVASMMPVRLTNNGAADREPTFSADGKRIVFVSNQNGYWDVYVMNSEGGRIKRLTNTAAVEGHPAFSPDGTQIVYHANATGRDEVYLLDIESGEVTQLTEAGGRCPTFSPDGKKIAFASLRDGNSEIYLMNADGSEQTRLTKDPGDDRNPVFSPSSLEIAFASTRHGGSDIYIMPLDGSGVQRLTNTGQAYHPSWSR